MSQKEIKSVEDVPVPGEAYTAFLRVRLHEANDLAAQWAARAALLFEQSVALQKRCDDADAKVKELTAPAS